MGKTVGQFDYRLIGDAGSLPMPTVHISLQRWSELENGTILISADLMTEREIDRWIRALKDDLDAVGRRAKAALKAAELRPRPAPPMKRMQGAKALVWLMWRDDALPPVQVLPAATP